MKFDFRTGTNVVDVGRLLELRDLVGVDLVLGDGVDLAEPGQVFLVFRVNIFQLFQARFGQAVGHAEK